MPCQEKGALEFRVEDLAFQTMGESITLVCLLSLSASLVSYAVTLAPETDIMRTCGFTCSDRSDSSRSGVRFSSRSLLFAGESESPTCRNRRRRSRTVDMSSSTRCSQRKPSVLHQLCSGETAVDQKSSGAAGVSASRLTSKRYIQLHTYNIIWTHFITCSRRTNI